MEIALHTFESRPYFLINNQLDDLYSWLTKEAHVLISDYRIGALIIGLLLLLVLLRLTQE